MLLDEHIKKLAEIEKTGKAIARGGGITVSVRPKDKSTHALPHMHIWYSGGEASVDLDGNILANSNVRYDKIAEVHKWSQKHRLTITNMYNGLIPIDYIEDL